MQYGHPVPIVILLMNSVWYSAGYCENATVPAEVFPIVLLVGTAGVIVCPVTFSGRLVPEIAVYDWASS